MWATVGLAYHPLRTSTAFSRPGMDIMEALSGTCSRAKTIEVGVSIGKIGLYYQSISLPEPQLDGVVRFFS